MLRLFTNSLAPIRHLAALIALATLFNASGCASDGSDAEQGPFISPLLDPDRETGTLIGPAGGSVQATGVDGTQYTLTIPADALVAETEITLTPILSVPDLPMSGGLIGGVHFEPSGLELQRAATLVVTRPSAPTLGSEELLAGFTYEGDGDNLALVLAEADGDSFALPVLHFSGGGAGAATPSDLEAAFAPGSADSFIAELLDAFDAFDTRALKSSFERWYMQRIKPALQAAVASDQALERALQEYRRWLTVESALKGLIDVDALRAESHSLAAAAFNDAIARANDLCERQESFAEAEKAMVWQRRAESVLPSDPLLTSGLDRLSVQLGLCVQVVYESTSFPDVPFAGEPETLRVVVGYAFGDGPIELAEGMVVQVLAIGALPGAATTATDGAGQLEIALTPEGGTLRVEVDTCIGNVPGAGPLTGGFICQEAFIVRGLVVSPASVTLGPGGSQQFTAELLGINESVTWSATGGTIDASGRFVAGATSGTFTITATSIAKPSLTATAQVTIEVVPSDFPASTVWRGPVVLHRDNGTTFIQNGGLVTKYNPSTGTLTARSCQGPEENCFGFGCNALWEGTVSGDQVSMTQVNHTSPCAIGDPGQNRLYGCTLTATFSQEADGTHRLVGTGDGTFFSCGGDVTSDVTFDVCVDGCPE